MPSEARPLCHIPEIKQQSVHGGTPEAVNRDLEVLFRTVNQLIRCVGRQADTITDISGSAAGSGQSGDSGAQRPAGGPLGGDSMRMTQGGDWSMPHGFVGTVFLRATAAHAVTLYAPRINSLVFLVNVSDTYAVTVKDDGGTAIGVLPPGSAALIPAFENDDHAPVWPSGIIVLGGNGIMLSVNDVIVGNDGAGLVLQSPDGHYWRTQVDNSGSIGTTDVGTDIPGMDSGANPPP